MRARSRPYAVVRETAWSMRSCSRRWRAVTASPRASPSAWLIPTSSAARWKRSAPMPGCRCGTAHAGRAMTGARWLRRHARHVRCQRWRARARRPRAGAARTASHRQARTGAPLGLGLGVGRRREPLTRVDSSGNAGPDDTSSSSTQRASRDTVPPETTISTSYSHHSASRLSGRPPTATGCENSERFIRVPGAGRSRSSDRPASSASGWRSRAARVASSHASIAAASAASGICSIAR